MALKFLWAEAAEWKRERNLWRTEMTDCKRNA